MSQLQLNRVSKEIIRHAEESLIPEQGLSRAVDDYFIQHLKQAEMDHAIVDPRLYEGLRTMVKAEVLPLYQQFREQTARFRERKQRRTIWKYVLGTVGILEVLEAIVTHGRSIAPQVLIPTALVYSFIGFILYVAAQYVDDLQVVRARKKLEQSIEGLESKIKTDADYDQRRELVDAGVLHGEAAEIVSHYEKPEEFWRDYCRVREADPTLPGEVKKLDLPPFESFLRFHVEGRYSEAARQHRFNRLFVEAQELFVSRDRSGYVMNHLKAKPSKPI
jgi:hypothetical protein